MKSVRLDAHNPTPTLLYHATPTLLYLFIQLRRPHCFIMYCRYGQPVRPCYRNVCFLPSHPTLTSLRSHPTLIDD